SDGESNICSEDPADRSRDSGHYLRGARRKAGGKPQKLLECGSKASHTFRLPCYHAADQRPSEEVIDIGLPIGGQTVLSLLEQFGEQAAAEALGQGQCPTLPGQALERLAR